MSTDFLFPWTSFEIAEVLLNLKKGSKPKLVLFLAIYARLILLPPIFKACQCPYIVHKKKAKLSAWSLGPPVAGPHLILLQLWLSFSFVKTPGFSLSQGLCTWCSICAQLQAQWNQAFTFLFMPFFVSPVSAWVRHRVEVSEVVVEAFILLATHKTKICTKYINAVDQVGRGGAGTMCLCFPGEPSLLPFTSTEAESLIWTISLGKWIESGVL